MNMNALLGTRLERPVQALCHNPTVSSQSRSSRPTVITCATAASARVKEAPSEIVQPVPTPRPLTTGLESSSRFSSALPSFGTV